MSDTTMTPDQFFDQLDEIFGEVDGYINHLQRIKELKEENERLEALKKEELEAIVKSDAGTMKLYGDIVSLMDKNTELQEENVKLKGEKEILDMRTGDGWYLAKLIEQECITLKEQYSKAVQDINQRDFERTSLLREIKELKEEVESKSSKKKNIKTTD